MASARIHVPSSGEGKHGLEFGHGQRTGQGIHAPEDTNSKDESVASEMPCDPARRAQNAGPDGVSTLTAIPKLTQASAEGGLS